MSTGSRLAHQVREATGEPAGALILVHGRGSDEHDLLPVLDALDPPGRFIGLTPGGPLSLPPGGRHWYGVPRVGFPDADTFAQGYGALTTFLDGWLAERGIGWERTVLGGFSQGAVMSYAVGLGAGRPSPAGILAMSGFVPVVDGWEAELESRRNLPVCIAHGASDPIIRVDFGHQARDLLTEGGLAVEYHESPAAHHLDPVLLHELTAWVQARI
ncbi:MAG: phospholipase [Solirubrobacterales bacterium]|jgi:phospholipase/carboxylesterase|nr:phospholipase [Solirubrobacterales bacterium]